MIVKKNIISDCFQLLENYNERQKKTISFFFAKAKNTKLENSSPEHWYSGDDTSRTCLDDKSGICTFAKHQS